MAGGSEVTKHFWDMDSGLGIDVMLHREPGHFKSTVERAYESFQGHIWLLHPSRLGRNGGGIADCSLWLNYSRSLNPVGTLS